MRGGVEFHSISPSHSSHSHSSEAVGGNLASFTHSFPFASTGWRCLSNHKQFKSHFEVKHNRICTIIVDLFAFQRDNELRELKRETIMKSLWDSGVTEAYLGQRMLRHRWTCSIVSISRPACPSLDIISRRWVNACILSGTVSVGLMVAHSCCILSTRYPN